MDLRVAKKNSHRIHGLLLALLVFVVMSLLFSLNSFRTLEWMADDIKTRLLRSDATADQQIVILLVDESSLSVMEPLIGRWPWPRSVWADILEYVAMGGGKSVVFDILFTERTYQQNGELNPHDQALVEMGQQTGFAIHAMQLLQDPDNPYADRPLPKIFAEKFAFRPVQGVPISQNNTYYIPFKALYETAHRMAVVEFSPDSDGTYRRTSLLRDYQKDFYPVLSLAPLIDVLQLQSAQQQQQFLQFQTKTGRLNVPLDRQGYYRVNFYRHFNSISIGSVLASIADLRQGRIEQLYQDPQRIPPDFFADKIVFVGTSAVGLEDMKDTPIQNRWPGVFLHASIASNLLQQDFIYTPPAWTVYVLMALAVMLSTLLVLKTSSILMQVGYPLGLAILYVWLNIWIQKQTGWQFDMVPVVLAIGLTWLTMSGYLSATEGREKRRVRKMLAQYVSPAALETVLDQYEDQAQAQVGDEREMTVVFSDVRSFTTLSEGLTPAQVVKLLNIHLEEMTQATFAYGGTMDKFIGDATMAFWGAPLPDPEHALHATEAAIAMQEAEKKVNLQLVEQGLPEIAIGVGVNTGKMVLGNIGSSQKLDYTVIGDAVNLGSRLEGLTKQYQLKILISEFTYQKLTGRLPCLLVDAVRVKGKHKAVKIYSPLCSASDEKLSDWQKVAEVSAAAFKAYQQQDFQQALVLYKQLPEQFSFFKNLYRQRCEAYLQEPPPKDWDGVYTLQTK